MEDVQIKITGSDPRIVGNALLALAEEFDGTMILVAEWNGYTLKFPQPEPSTPEPPKAYIVDVISDIDDALEQIAKGNDPGAEFHAMKDEYQRLLERESPF